MGPSGARLTFQVDDPGRPPVRALLEAHLAFARACTPPESVHALDLAGLRTPDVTFWSAQDGDEVVACGALRTLDASHGEVKSMHTLAARRGAGIGARMLEHLIAEARRRGWTRLSLETGTMPEFAPARGLYARFGFVECRPFGGYRVDPVSVCMTLELTS